MTLRMLFVCLFVCLLCLFWGSLVFMKQLIGITERPDHATFSLAKSMTFPIFGNADTQSANHKQINFHPYLRTT